MINRKISTKINTPFCIGNIYAYSIRGRVHELNNIANQDSFGFFENDKSIGFALADGVGSCRRSDAGSKLAMLAIEELTMELSEKQMSEYEIKQYIFNNWINKIQSDVDNYATTLRFGIITEQYYILGSIGDGKTISSDSQYYQVEDEQFFSNYTDALTSNIAWNKFYVNKFAFGLAPISICLMTDGISNEIDVAKESGLLSYLKNIVEKQDESNFEISKWISKLQEHNGDDKTLLFITVIKH